ncbi:hypothetical protein IF650_05945 [Cellulosimicrobium terreum]|nr:hypothetical protein [Cellulosimicrobium terreum]
MTSKTFARRVTAAAGAVALATAFATVGASGAQAAQPSATTPAATSTATQPAAVQAAGLSCDAAWSEPIDGWGMVRVHHSCSGTGNVKYTVHCWIGTPVEFTAQWTQTQNRWWDVQCGFGTNGVWSVNYEIVS